MSDQNIIWVRGIIRNEVHMRLPDIYIIGVQKAGTTSLYDWLSQHPNIYGVKSAKDNSVFGVDRVYNAGLERYAKLFKAAPTGSMIVGGEASAIYLPKGVERIKKHIPNAKIIVSLRNPITRAFSAWRYAVEKGVEERNFDLAVSDELKNIKIGERPSMLTDTLYKDYLQRGNYYNQLERLYLAFPRSQVRVVLFEDICHSPDMVISELFKFLQLNEYQPNLSIRNKTKGGSRFKIIQKILYTPRSEGDLLAKLTRGIFTYQQRHALREILDKINRKEAKWKPEMSASSKAILLEYYRDDIKKTLELIEKPLDLKTETGWPGGG